MVRNGSDGLVLLGAFETVSALLFFVRRIDHVTCRNPGGAVLYRDLTFSVPHGVNTLIMGPSGSGKSSLLRLVGGLWPFERGLIRRPTKIGRDGLFFVPQRPYISDSTLRAQMIYPDAESRVGDDVLQVRDCEGQWCVSPRAGCWLAVTASVHRAGILTICLLVCGCLACLIATAYAGGA